MYFFFIIFLPSERNTKFRKKAKILHVINNYFQSNPLFCRAGFNDNFHLRFVAILHRGGVKMTSESLQQYHVIVTQRSAALLVKYVYFSNYMCCFVPVVSSKMGKKHLFPCLHGCNSRSIKDILTPF